MHAAHRMHICCMLCMLERERLRPLRPRDKFSREADRWEAALVGSLAEVAVCQGIKYGLRNRNWRQSDRITSMPRASASTFGADAEASCPSRVVAATLRPSDGKSTWVTTPYLRAHASGAANAQARRTL
eukprot:1397861-Prymnesium_polylepis.1